MRRSFPSTFPLLALRALLAALVVTTAAAVAAPAGVLTLDEAVQMALERNERIAAARAGVGVAQARLRAARALLWPRLELSGTATRTTNPVAVFSGLLGQEAFTEADFDVGRLNEPDPFDDVAGSVTVSQSLWSGGAVRAGIEAAELERAAAVLDARRTDQEIAREVVETYTGAVLARRALAVARESLETAQAHVVLVADLHEAGLVVRSDLLQAQLRETELAEMLARAEGRLATARAGLDVVLGRDAMAGGDAAPYELPGDLAPPDQGLAALDELLAAARASRPDRMAAERRAAAAANALQAARAGRLPSVVAGGSFDTHADELAGIDGTSWTAWVGARWQPYAGGLTRARVDEAEHLRRLAASGRRQLDQAIDLEVRRAWHELRAARAGLEQATRGVELARASLEIVRDRYAEGLATWVELLDAETALARSRARELAARRALWVGGAALALATGTPFTEGSR